MQSETSVHFMNYHFVWTPKYRRKVIVGDVEKRLKSLLKEKCNQLNIEIISLETMPDHVHIFLDSQPTIAPNRIAAALKGYTSRILRQEFSELRVTYLRYGVGVISYPLMAMYLLIQLRNT